MKYDDDTTDVVRLSLNNFLHILSEKHGNGDINNRQCSITFIGDSLMEDTMVAMECQLMMLGYRNSTECVFAHIGSTNYNKNINYTCHNSASNINNNNNYNNNNLSSQFQRQFVNLQSQSCRIITLSFINNFLLYEITTDQFIKKFIQPQQNDHNNTLVLVNYGAHSNYKEHLIKRYLKIVKNLTILLNQSNYKVFWKEIEPQHFYSFNGYFSTKLLNLSCTNTIHTYDNWKTSILEEMITSRTFPSLPIVYIYNDTLPFSFLHQTPDCTHYCYLPYRFTFLWNKLTDLLLYLS